MSRNRPAAVVALALAAALLALSLVSPAVGGPSVRTVAKTAKKAVKTGKRALKTARRARTTARRADSRARDAGDLARTANGKADQALARPVVTAAGITPVSATATILPGDVEVAAAICPAGQRAISGGGTVITGVGGLWTDRASDDRTAWFAGGEDAGGLGGTVTAYAYCVPAGQATIAGNSRARVMREANELERERRGR